MGTATTNKTRMLAANATNASNATKAPVQTEWTLNLFVQPDPFAKKVDNAATATQLGGTAVLAAIDSVTKATYGAMTAKAAVVTEAAVKFAKTPARRMLNATNKTTTAKAAGPVVPVNLQSKD